MPRHLLGTLTLCGAILSLPLASTTQASVIAGPIVNPANGHSYYVLDAATGIDSEAAAVSLGGHLATIRDQSENDWVFNNVAPLAPSPGNVWIGLTDIAAADPKNASSFYWTSGDTSAYRNWRCAFNQVPCDPNNFDTEFCVHMVGPGGDFGQSQWVNQNCSILLPGIVEVPECNGDIDCDGVPDSSDQCPNTPRGEPVDSDGCSCSQKTCDDGNPCNGLETCDVATGQCRDGSVPDPCTLPACSVLCKGKLLMYRGNKLSSPQDKWLKYMATTVEPALKHRYPDRNDRLRAVAETSWWGLGEGSLGLPRHKTPGFGYGRSLDCGQPRDPKGTPCPGLNCTSTCDVAPRVTNSNLFSNCSRFVVKQGNVAGYCGNFHLYCKPLELCNPDPCLHAPISKPGVCAFQVGIVAAQVPRHGTTAGQCTSPDDCKKKDATDEAYVRDKVTRLFGSMPSLTPILREAVTFAGLDPSGGIGQAIVNSDSLCEQAQDPNNPDWRTSACQLRRAWVVHHPAVNVLVEDDAVRNDFCALPSDLSLGCDGGAGCTTTICDDEKELFHIMDVLSPP
jgi:hypothetical protein